MRLRQQFLFFSNFRFELFHSRHRKPAWKFANFRIIHSVGFKWSRKIAFGFFLLFFRFKLCRIYGCKLLCFYSICYVEAWIMVHCLCHFALFLEHVHWYSCHIIALSNFLASIAIFSAWKVVIPALTTIPATSRKIIVKRFITIASWSTEEVHHSLPSSLVRNFRFFVVLNHL